MSNQPRRGFSIRIYLVDGLPDGLRIVEKSNWTGKAVVCPRSRFPDAKSRLEFGRTGGYCGYNSPRSYGGTSYFIRHPTGNWLIDSPKFVTPLVQRLEALGGIAHIFLTHQDDVADAERYAEHFKSRRIIHRDELSWQPAAEVVLNGNGPWGLPPGLLDILRHGQPTGSW